MHVLLDTLALKPGPWPSSDRAGGLGLECGSSRPVAAGVPLSRLDGGVDLEQMWTCGVRGGGSDSLLPSDRLPLSDGQLDLGEVSEADGDGVVLFQTRQTGRSRWEDLIEVLSRWFENRRVGMAICMIRGVAEQRGDKTTWSGFADPHLPELGLPEQPSTTLL